MSLHEETDMLSDDAAAMAVVLKAMLGAQRGSWGLDARRGCSTGYPCNVVQL